MLLQHVRLPTQTPPAFALRHRRTRSAALPSPHPHAARHFPPQMYISFSHTRPLFGRGSPGPGSQGSHNSSIGKQTSSKKKTAPVSSGGVAGLCRCSLA